MTSLSKPKGFLPISIGSTARKCVECLQPATHFRYYADKQGRRVDKSSRVPVCAVHGPTK